MYLALYRKFRPTTFDGIIGQEHITTTLKNQIVNRQLTHAYLFCGSRGTGKTTCAKVFARAMNCLSPLNDGSPCGKCEVCQKLQQSNNIDILEIDAASNNGVDEIRDLREKIKYAPTVGKYKVYIIDEVHMLSIGAFNALLKTLEEPPAHAVFILATTEVHKLPATILSRVMRFDFKLISTEQIAKNIEKIFNESNIKAEPSAINLIARAGEGSMRDALSIADMCASFCNNNITYNQVIDVLGVSDKQTIYALIKSILQQDTNQFFMQFNQIASQGKNLKVVASDITKGFRDLLVIKSCGQNCGLVDYKEDLLKNMAELANNFETLRINKALQAFSKIEAELKYATNPQLLLETTALSLVDDEVKKN